MVNRIRRRYSAFNDYLKKKRFRSPLFSKRKAEMERGRGDREKK